MLGRKLMVLVPASLAGFAARGGSAASLLTVTKFLLVLFVAVFFVALALSAVTEPSAAQQGPESRGIGQGHPDLPRVSHAAAYEAQ